MTDFDSCFTCAHSSDARPGVRPDSPDSSSSPSSPDSPGVTGEPAGTPGGVYGRAPVSGRAAGGTEPCGWRGARVCCGGPCGSYTHDARRIMELQGVDTDCPGGFLPDDSGNGVRIGLDFPASLAPALKVFIHG